MIKAHTVLGGVASLCAASVPYMPPALLSLKSPSYHTISALCYCAQATLILLNNGSKCKISDAGTQSMSKRSSERL